LTPKTTNESDFLMTSLSSILAAGGGDDIRNLWDNIEAAGELAPLPPGEYTADLIAGELESSRSKGTPGYKMTFAIVEPSEYAGRRFWHDCWLTPAALPSSKRDLLKIGVTNLEQLEQPLPARIRCLVKLALRRDDDGNERNKVRSFNVIGIVEPERDAFAPPDDIDPICPKCQKPIDGCYGGCLACDTSEEAEPDDFF
jgi:hypothetical protein